MAKSKEVGVKQELVHKVEKGKYKSLYESGSQANQNCLQKLTKQRTSKGLEPTRIVGKRAYTCTNGFVHHIKVVKYDDGSVWVMCPMFGWYEEAGLEGILKLGCKERKKRCTWFIG